MALRNAFEAIALESTANSNFVDQITSQRELLQDILTELKKLNLYMQLMTDAEVTNTDLDQVDRL